MLKFPNAPPPLPPLRRRIARFTFGIPRGSDGSNGSDGSQGPPGDISQAQLDNAISGTNANTNSVSTLDTGFADPDMEALRQKFNEMILNGRR
jgi:hypothetical protein